MKKFKNLTLDDFLDCITQKEKQLSLTIYTEKGKQERVGTREEIIQFFLEVEDDKFRKSSLKQLNAVPEQDFSYGQADIIQYLDKATKNSSDALIKNMLFEIMHYRYERVQELQNESHKTYLRNDWEIPYRMEHFKGEEEPIKIPVYKDMLWKTHPWWDKDITFSYRYLGSKLKKTNSIPKKKINSIEEVIDLEELKKITARLANMVEGRNFFKTSNKKLFFKSKGALFAFLINLEEKGMLLKLSLKDNLDEIGMIFLKYYDLSSKADDPIQHLKKYLEIAPSTRLFFEKNL